VPLGAVPRLKAVSEGVGAASDRIESEVVLDLVLQILAEAGSALVACQSRHRRTDEAVVFIRREIEFLVVDAHRIPLVKQVAQLACEVSEPLLIDLRVRHADILTGLPAVPAPGRGLGLTIGGIRVSCTEARQ
jgi:hypothetical protein